MGIFKIMLIVIFSLILCIAIPVITSSIFLKYVSDKRIIPGYIYQPGHESPFVLSICCCMCILSVIVVVLSNKNV